MQFSTPAFFDTLIVVIMVIGIALATVRLYRDFTRPLPPNPNTMVPPRKDDAQ